MISPGFQPAWRDNFRRIYLLGALRVEEGQNLLRIPRGKSQSLLVYLALDPQAGHRREVLADLLWPDGASGRVYRNLSDALYRLRQALGEGWLQVDPETISLDSDSGVWVDSWEFQNLARSDEPANLLKAVELYTGELAPEIYDDWILVRRVYLHEQYLLALEKLVEYYQAAHDLAQALKYARRLITIEPLREHNQQTYLRLLGRLQHRNEALVHYEYLQQMLYRELRVEPMSQTRAIVEAIRREAGQATPLPSPVEFTPFVGRAAERASLLMAVEATIGGQGRLLAVEGEAGIGKSRLLREVAEGGRWRGIVVLSGSSTAQPGLSPLSPLAAAIKSALAGPRAALVESMLPVNTPALLAPLYEPWRTTHRPALPPEQSQRFFQQALRELFRALTSLNPHLLILDDLQWAEPALWSALDALKPVVERNRLMILIAYRRPEIEHNPGWELLQQWEREGYLQALTLQPLQESDTARLLPPELQSRAQEVLAATAGSPFFIREMLIALNEGQPFQPTGTLLARLARLPAAARQALEVAAVVGQQVPYHLWAATVGLTPPELAEIGEHLENRYFLQSNQAGYTFSHDLVLSAVYAGIEPARCRQLHLQVAGNLAGFDPANFRARAFHLDRAGAAGEASLLYRQAGEQDLASFAFKEAQQSFERSLALMSQETRPERVKTLLALAQVCHVTGDQARRQSALEEALQGATALASDVLATEALLLLGQSAAQTGQVELAEQYLDRARTTAEALADPTQSIEADFLLGDLAARRGSFDPARRYFEAALDRARHVGDRLREGRALRGIGICLRQSGQPEQAIEWLEKALAVQVENEDRLEASITQANLLGGFYYLGAWDRLLTLTGQALALKETLGDRLGAAIVRQMQGLAAYALGDLAAARPILEQVIRDSEEVDERRTAGLTRNVLGLVAEDEGNMVEAQTHYEAALATAEDIKAVTEAAYARHDLGALYLKIKEPARAVPLLEAARVTWAEQKNELLQLKSEACLGLALLALNQQTRAEALAEAGWAAFQRGTASGEQPQGWLWMLHRLLAALGRAGEAGQVLQAAYQELQRQARAIQDPEKRRSFFEQVPLNRSIVAAHGDMVQARQRVTVSLARRDAPLGRPLASAEMIAVSWTLDAPEDEAIGSPADRRRYRLQRLLAEAVAQGAVPTDDDLAAALKVSRRTILRDMASLARAGVILPTRRRTV